MQVLVDGPSVEDGTDSVEFGSTVFAAPVDTVHYSLVYIAALSR
jgi:hypothetical protein